MKQVILKEIKIQNFKGIKDQSLSFGKVTQIKGKNGCGKSSVYNAYMWCLFNKDFNGSEIAVQPLDKDNNIIHKVLVSVECLFEVDGINMSVRREQKEKWIVNKLDGSESLQGNEQKRYINEMALSQKDFTDKLNEICPVANWLFLSSIFAFPNYPASDKRSFLIRLTQNVDMTEIAKPFPFVYDNLKKGISVNDMIAIVKSRHSKASAEMQTIQPRIEECNSLIREYDYDALRKERERLSSDVLTGASSELSQLMSEKQELYVSLFSAHNAKLNSIIEAENKARESYNAISREYNSLNSEMALCNKKKDSLNNDLANTRSKWVETQNAVMALNCPTCGRPFSQDEIASKKSTALAGVQAKGVEIKAQIEAVDSKISELNTQMQLVKESLNKALVTLNDLTANKASLRDYRIEDDKSYQDLCNRIETAKNGSVDMTFVKSRIEELDSQIAQENTNTSLRSRIAELESQGKALGREIADCEACKVQIRAFKKAHIEAVEEYINSYFSIVRWKMFEQNLSNDNEKEICQAVINGVPYELQNTAMRYNAGLDIVNGLSLAMDVNVPIFIDNKESVTNLINTPSQLITIEVEPNADFHSSIIC